jgi:hypothetical protein
MTNFDWMQHVCYEPPPLRRRSWRPHLFWVLAGMAIASGALVALSGLVP